MAFQIYVYLNESDILLLIGALTIWLALLMLEGRLTPKRPRIQLLDVCWSNPILILKMTFVASTPNYENEAY